MVICLPEWFAGGLQRYKTSTALVFAEGKAHFTCQKRK